MFIHLIFKPTIPLNTLLTLDSSLKAVHLQRNLWHSIHQSLEHVLPQFASRVFLSAFAHLCLLPCQGDVRPVLGIEIYSNEAADGIHQAEEKRQNKYSYKLSPHLSTKMVTSCQTAPHCMLL